MYIIFSSYSSNHFTDFLWFQKNCVFLKHLRDVWEDILFVCTLGLKTSYQFSASFQNGIVDLFFIFWVWQNRKEVLAGGVRKI